MAALRTVLSKLLGLTSVPFIPQMEATECGAACLSMVLASHGRHTPLAEVRLACGVSRDGASALSILRAAKDYGLLARGVSCEPEALDEVPLPAILHWDLNHFVVLDWLSKRNAMLVDPRLGVFVMDRALLGRHFTGVALLFEPADGFCRRPRTRPGLARYTKILREHLPSLGQTLGASILLQVAALVFPVANQLLLDWVIVPRQPAWLWGVTLGLSTAVACRMALQWMRGFVLQSIQLSMDQQLLSGFVEHLLRLPLHFFAQRQPGDLMQRVSSHVVMRDLLSTRTASVILDCAFLAMILVVMLAYDTRLGAIVLAFATARVLLLAILRRRNQRLMAAELAGAGRDQAVLVEALSPLETIRASGAEGRMADRWTDRAIDRLNVSAERGRLELLTAQVMLVMSSATTIVVFLVGGGRVIDERMTIGVFAAFLTLQNVFLEPLESLLSAVSTLQYGESHLQRLDDVMATALEVSGPDDIGTLEGGIRLEGVSFAYSPGGNEVLSGIDVEVRPGEFVALVGPSGAGKSTLARLLVGLHIPTSGTLRFDGRDLRTLDLQRLRRRLGVVPQESFLFDDTVRANLALGDPHRPFEELREAARLACVDDVIESLPLGYYTRIGENGRQLSGGQRQRLCLARALTGKPAILLLDEPTSALDEDLESRIQKNLARLGCTRVVIAHRLATIAAADRILALDRGRIVQEGSYEALSQTPGLFRDFVLARNEGTGS